MKNANYNLVKMLLMKLDDHWRVDKHYARDAKELGCKGCMDVLKTIIEDDAEHAELLRAELARHVKEKKFD